MNYDLIIFDMDGTILDTLTDIMTACNFALKKNGLPERSYDEIKWFVGNGIPKLIERACPKGTNSEVQNKVLDDFTPFYEKHSADNTKPYDGIVELLKTLRNAGIKTAVNSNKLDFACKALCKDFFNGLFDYEYGAREGVPNKPAPDTVNEICSLSGIPKNRTAYIGDSDVDATTAHNAEVDFIGAEWGFRGREFLLEHGAKITAQKPLDLVEVLLK